MANRVQPYLTRLIVDIFLASVLKIHCNNKINLSFNELFQSQLSNFIIIKKKQIGGMQSIYVVQHKINGFW